MDTTAPGMKTLRYIIPPGNANGWIVEEHHEGEEEATIIGEFLRQSDALLFLASDDLLSALRGLLGHVYAAPGSGWGPFHDAISAAQRAIGKATTT